MVSLVEPPEPGAMVNVEATPVPDKVTVCGLAIASSVSASVPVCDPEAEGVKITPILQEAAGDSVLPQIVSFGKLGRMQQCWQS